MELNQMELQNIRHTCNACSATCKKLNYYTTSITDQNAVQILNKICNTCDSIKQDIISNM